MTLAKFLAALREGGRLRVGAPGDPGPDELREAALLLREIDRDLRLECPLEPPPLAIGPALWAAVTVYCAAQFLAHRAVDGDTVRRVLARPCPSGSPPAEAAWSADLSLRALPDLLALARGIAEDDPLTTSLRAIGRTFPLSSIGADGLGDAEPGAAIDDPALLALYADRVIERRDRGRLADPRVRRAVEAAIGAHAELAPGVAEALVAAAPAAAALSGARAGAGARA